MKLDPWQEEALKPSRRLLLCTGRQVGKTYIMARKAAERMLKVPGSSILVVSLTEDQAHLIISMVLFYIEEKNKHRIRKGKYKPTKSRIYLKNQSHILARPVGTTGNAVRGYTASVLIVDEASRMPEDVWTAAKATGLTKSAEIWMCSTPAGRRGYFYKSFENKGGNWKVIHISSEDVIKNRPISESWTLEQREGALELLVEEKADMTISQYGQEYLGLFMEDLNQFFHDDLIKEAMTLQSPPNGDAEVGVTRPCISGDPFLGVDVAGMGGDETVLFSLERTQKKKLSQVGLQVYKNVRTTETVRRIKDADTIYKYKGIYIDDGGMGVGVFDPLLEDRQTRRKVVAINNAARSLDNEDGRKKKLLKEDLYNNLLSLMERGQIKLWRRPEIALSLRSVQAEWHNGKLRIHGRYTHIAEALIRAAWCVKDKRLNIWIA